MISFVSNLKLLTEDFIEASGGLTSREVRDALVAEIFPLLTDKERKAFSDKTEYAQVERFIIANYGHETPDDVLEFLTRKWIRSMRIDEAAKQRSEQSDINTPKRAP